MKEPPYPADTRAKGWRFELDLEQVIQSDTWALATPDVRPWLLMLWTTAWQQTPCGSMPSDDALIVARLGISPKVYTKAKPVLLRGWWAATDGRLYHDTLSDRVLDMLGRKNAERSRKAAWRASKEAEQKLAEVNAMAQNSPQMSHGTNEGQPRDRRGTDDTGTGTGTGTGLCINTPPPPREEGESHVPNLSHGTDAGRICKAMKSHGITDVNPSHPVLRTLIEAGATDGEFTEAARLAASESKGFAYAIGIVSGGRKRAALLAEQIHRGSMPKTETAYQRSMRERVEQAAPGVAAKAPNDINNPAHASRFFAAIDVQSRTIESA